MKLVSSTIRVFIAFAAAFLVAIIVPADPAKAQDEPIRFTVEVVGEGPDVILIPGISTPREVWHPTAERLQASHRLHLVQVRGFGDEAGANAQGPVLEPLVDELAQYISDANLEAPIVVGHSLGGLAALMLGEAHPELAGQLVIVDALPWIGAIMGGSDVASIETRAATMRDMLAATYGTSPTRDGAAANLANQALTPEAFEQVVTWVMRADPRVTATLLYEDMITDMRQRIASIHAPVTVIYPWNEHFPTEQQAQIFYGSQYAALESVELVGIGPAAHFVMLDRPEGFHLALEAILRGD